MIRVFSLLLKFIGNVKEWNINSLLSLQETKRKGDSQEDKKKQSGKASMPKNLTQKIVYIIF